MSIKTIIGKVIKVDKNDTAKILTTRTVKHKKYHKKYEITKKYLVVNPDNKYKVDQNVIIESIRPVSKNKYFKIKKELK